MASPFSGLIAATYTPFRPDGGLNLSRIDSLVQYLLGQGVSGFYVNGSTGEGPSLTTAERKQTAEAYVAAVRGRLPVIVQVGHNSLSDARDLAQHAQQIQAQAVSAVAPSYFKPASVEALVECMANIAGGAPQLPFYYYHIPSLAGVQVDMPTFLRRAAERIPTFAGIKYTAPTIWEYQASLAVDDGRFDCLYGLDEMLLPALAVGAKGAVGSTYNFAAPVYLRLIAAFEAGDLEEARRCQNRAIEMVRILFRHGGFAAMKAMMKLIGQDCGPVRLPVSSLSDEAIRALEKELRGIGFFEWIEVPVAV